MSSFCIFDERLNLSLTLLFICFSLYIIIFRGKKIFEPARYMTINECIEQLFECEKERQEKGDFLSPNNNNNDHNTNTIYLYAYISPLSLYIYIENTKD